MLEINGKSYFLSGSSKVFIKETMEEQPVFMMKDGSHFFLARGEDKVTTKISLGLFVLNAAGMFKLPLEHWSKVSVGYLDDDVDNLDDKNLYLIYPEEGIPYPGLPGYRYIPGFEKNAIHSNGQVYRSLRRSFYAIAGEEPVISGEYPIAKLDGVKGDERRYVHRLLGITWKSPPKNYPVMQVDHDDGNKLNYHLDNLVWVTRSENNLKAFYEQGLRPDNKPIDVFDKETGTVLQFKSMTEFADMLECDQWLISIAIKNKVGVYRGRWVIKFKEDPRTFAEVEKDKHKVIGKVKYRNVFTLGEGEYKNPSEAERLAKVSSTSIQTAIYNNNPRSVYGNCQWKRAEDETPWEDLNEYELECVRLKLQANASAYEVTNVRTKEKWILYGNDAVAAITGANTRTVMVCAREGKLLLKKYSLKKLTR